MSKPSRVRCLKVIPGETMPCYLELGHKGDHECYALKGPADRSPIHWSDQETSGTNSVSVSSKLVTRSEKRRSDMMPMPVNDVDIAFGGAGKMQDLLPKYETLPEEFRRELDPFSPLVNRWFGVGIEKSKFKVKEGIDEKAAWRHLRTIMGSFEPKHEHKIAGVAYLMSQWFDLVDSETKMGGHHDSNR